MTHFEHYRICGSHKEAMAFIERLEQQNVEYKIVLGNHPTLGDWTKIEYADGYDPFKNHKVSKEA